MNMGSLRSGHGREIGLKQTSLVLETEGRPNPYQFTREAQNGMSWPGDLRKNQGKLFS